MTYDNIDIKLETVTNHLSILVEDLERYIKMRNSTKNTNSIPKSKCSYVRDKNNKERISCYNIEAPKFNKGSRLADKKIKKKIIDGKVMAKWGDKYYPVCDGWGYPYVEGCYNDASNWSTGAKQCIIENPASPNIASGSLYTCGFIW